MNETKFYEELLGLSDLKILSLETSPTKFIFHCQYTKELSVCPVCLEPTGKINQRDVRRFRDLKISEREVWLYVKVPQFLSKKETLLAHFQSLGTGFCEQIELVACDIWKTYINVAKECFPNCEVVIDWFHLDTTCPTIGLCPFE